MNRYEKEYFLCERMGKRKKGKEDPKMIHSLSCISGSIVCRVTWSGFCVLECGTGAKEFSIAKIVI